MSSGVSRPASTASIKPANVLKYVEQGTGREIDIVPFDGKHFDVKPLGFDELISAAAASRPSFPLNIRNAKASTALTGLEIEGPLRVTATMHHDGPLAAFGLVDGGWLPMPWAHKRTALLDRNLVIRLEKLQASEGGATPAQLTQWLGLDSETVSPLLFALEGTHRRAPTQAEVAIELERAHDALAKLLPGAKVQKVGARGCAALYQTLCEHAVFRERATRLLIHAAPLVAEPLKPGVRVKVEAELAGLASAEGVRKDCLAFLALLSCIYDSRPLSPHYTARPGRAVLKPKKNHSAQAAYNALADLFFLELMCNVHAVLPDVNPVLYTADAGLAAFWTALQPCTREVTHLPAGTSRTTVTFNMSGGLFPDLTDEEVALLAGRIKGLGS